MSAPARDKQQSSLYKEFKDPSMLARPRAFWPWLNGNAERGAILRDLQEMKAKGMGGAEVWDVAAVRNPDFIPAGPEFLSPPSAELIRYALKEGKKLGLRMGMITSSGWNAGGTWVTPDWASKMLVTSEATVAGGSKTDLKLPLPPIPKGCPLKENGEPVFSLEIATLAFPDNGTSAIASLDKIINITDKVQPGGRLTWEAPPGQWRILRFVCTNNGQVLIVPSPNSNGLFIDFLDPEATRRHLKIILDKLEITPENARESGLDYLEVDSMELHEGSPWTDKFAAWFQKEFHYDLIPWLPALAGYTIKDKTASDAFVYDYRKAVSNLLIHSHYETGSQFLSKYGIDFVGEAGGPGPPIWNTCPVDALKALGNVTVPRGEFWIKHRNMFLIKEVASAAHIYGKPIVDAESFTTWRRYEDAPFALKQVADRAFTEGLNQITIHTFAHSPESAGKPGRVYHAGIDINPATSWWPFARPFMDYLARCSTMLRQGKPVADVLWYYGDQAPNFFPLFHNVPDKPRLPGLSRGYEFDVINSDVILNRLKIKDGRFTLPEGTSYRVLAIAPDAVLPAEVATKLAGFVRQGGILQVGDRPANPAGLQESDTDATRRNTALKNLWPDQATTGIRTLGKGKIYQGKTPDETLKAEKVEPDIWIKPGKAFSNFDFVHRRTGSADIYFVRNRTEKPQSAQFNFRTINAMPQVWDPATGKAQSVDYSAAGEYTNCKLAFQAGEALFVVFDKKAVPIPMAEIYTTSDTLAVNTPWTVRFPEGSGAPASFNLTALSSLSKEKKPGYKFFSGIATYETSLTLTESALTRAKRIELDLGKVADIASVTVNDQPAGVAWKPPYLADVTSHLKPGENRLTIEVANLWNNRLVGDSNTTESKRILKTNLPLPDPKHPLQPSGLMGPVNIIIKK